jgi:hypothetical protein
MRANPFTPVFGSEPLVLAGRERIVHDILEGLESGIGNPNRVTIFIGPQGSGKTVLLSHIEREAAPIGWIFASVTAAPGMLAMIVEQAQKQGAEFLPKKARVRLAGISAYQFGIQTEVLPLPTPSWRTQMTEILEILAEQDVGLLITVDEVDAKQDEMVRLVSDFQHFIREKRNVALLMAGLPGKVLQMFHHESISFVRRAFQHRLNTVGIEDVKLALRKTVEASGRAIEGDALDKAAAYTEGFPFLIQLIGYHMWRQSPQNETVSVKDVEYGILAAEEDMDNMILETTVKELSERDLDFLIAMLEDSEYSKMADLRTRLNTSSAMAGQYRLRLIRQGVIEEFGHGKVRFTLPLLRTYLEKHYS